MHTATVMPNNA